MCSSQYDTKVKVGPFVHLCSTLSIFLFHLLLSAKFPHMALIRFCVLYLKWPFFSLVLVTCLLNSLLFQYLMVWGFFPSVYISELSLVWTAFIKHDYVNCIVS